MRGSPRFLVRVCEERTSEHTGCCRVTLLVYARVGSPDLIPGGRPGHGRTLPEGRGANSGKTGTNYACDAKWPTPHHLPLQDANFYVSASDKERKTRACVQNKR